MPEFHIVIQCSFHLQQNKKPLNDENRITPPYSILKTILCRNNLIPNSTTAHCKDTLYYNTCVTVYGSAFLKIAHAALNV